MSFSAEVKKEISGGLPSSPDRIAASLATILMCVGEIRIDHDGLWELWVSPDNRAALTKCFTLLQKTANITFNAEVRELLKSKSRGGRTPVRVDMSSSEVRELAELLNFSDQGGVPDMHQLGWELLSDFRCVQCYLQDLFLCTGSVSDPDKEYKLEFLCAYERQADQLFRILDERGIAVKRLRRRRYSVVSCRDAASIADLLALMGAHASLMQLENSRIVRQMRGNINRQVNCETANIKKTVTAAQRQIDDIALVLNSPIYSQLPAGLRQMARIRMDHPDYALKDLGEMLDPPVGKSGVNHRLRRLSELAEEIRRTQTANGSYSTEDESQAYRDNNKEERPEKV